MKISFLIHDIYGVGGTNRTVINLAEALAQRHEVSIVSVFRRRDRTMFQIPPKVSVRALVDCRRDSPELANPRISEPSSLIPPAEERYQQYNRLTDERLAHFLAQCESDVVIGTRPGLNLCVAGLAPDAAVKIAQEHMTHEMVAPAVRDQMRVLYPRLDASITLTDADARVFAATTPIPGLRVLSIPNSAPASRFRPASCPQKIVISAGRLDAVKQYDHLVEAFAKVVAERSDWTLRIYGDGEQRRYLEDLIQELDLYNNVFLMGRFASIEAEWAKGSIAAATSARESFGMTLVEAMRAGLPVVSTNAPVGPAEIVRHGVDGLIVPVGDVGAIAGGLLELMADEPRRRSMAAEALRHSERFDPADIGRRYEDLMLELRSGRQTRSRWRALNPATRATEGIRHLRGRAAAMGMALRLLPQPALEEVVADCSVLGPGASLISIRLPERPPVGPYRLVCAERRDRGFQRCVTIAISERTARSKGGRADLAAGVLDITLVADSLGMAEGIWDLYLEDPAGMRLRLKAGHNDSRALIGVDPSGPIVNVVPYRATDGFLSLRVWRRWPHAELERVSCGSRGITLSGRVLGAPDLGAAASLVVSARRDSQRTMQFDCTADAGGGFSATIPMAPLIQARRSRHDDWNVFVRMSHLDAPVRVARLMDDLVDRKSVYRYPTIMCWDEVDCRLFEETPAAAIKVNPYISFHGELSISVIERQL